MTPEDKQFVREQATHNRPDIQRVLSLLIESEAMREKAEFYHHPDCTVEQHTFSANREICKHDRTDSDWIEAKTKELMG